MGDKIKMTTEERIEEYVDKNVILNGLDKEGVVHFKQLVKDVCIKCVENEIAELGELCLQLQKDKGELTDENKVLKQNLEDSEIVNKSLTDRVANLEYLLEGRDNEIKELEAQIEKMKCCGNCKYYQFQNDAGYYTCIKDGKRIGKLSQE